MVTLLFTAAALVAFLDKASNDLLVEAHVTVANRLRIDAYSAVEVTLAVLQDFLQADSGLHSPSEGWSDPLAWAGWSPEDGNRVEVSFEDESGKTPAGPRQRNNLSNLFQIAWQMNPADAQHLSDVILSWMQKSYVPTTGISPDYEQSTIPYDPPLRPMRSFSELAAIDYAKDIFYDDGLPNDLWWRFHNDFSIFNYGKPDINGANADVMAAVGQFDDDQQQNVSNYLAGTGDYTVSTLGKQWFQQHDLRHRRGRRLGQSRGLRYRHLGPAHQHHRPRGRHAEFHLSVVVAPPGRGPNRANDRHRRPKKGTSSGTSGEASAATNGLNSGHHQSSSTATAAPRPPPPRPRPPLICNIPLQSWKFSKTIRF